MIVMGHILGPFGTRGWVKVCPYTEYIDGLLQYSSWWLGFCDRQSLYDYEKREEFSCIIKSARLAVENDYELSLRSNSCTGAIFALKNMGWRDKTEVEQSGGLTINWKEERTYETK